MWSFPPTKLVETFADDVLRFDLPGLPDDRRASTTRFVAGRVGGIPSPVRLGVGVVAVVVGVVSRLIGGARTVGLLHRLALPVVSEYLRLVRSLGYAFVWERWPDTSPHGLPAVAGVDALESRP